MKSILSGTVAALALCVAAGGAEADSLDFYITVESGALLFPDPEVSVGGATGDLDTSAGYMVGLEGGILLDWGLRAGAEFFFSGFSPNDLDLGVGGSSDLSGSASALGMMGVVAYEYQGFGAFRPFIEGGAGMLRVGLNDVDAPALAGSVDDSDMVFAAKVGAGFAVPILDRWDFLVRYNYIFAGDADLEFTSGGVTSPFEMEFSGHMVGAGLRYMF